MGQTDTENVLETGQSASLRLVAYSTEPRSLKLRPAVPRREWMDKTHVGVANRCLPMLIANQWGWFILNDRRIELKWNGALEPAGLRIRYGNKTANERADYQKPFATNRFGHGIVTFYIPFLFQTQSGWNLYVRGPANWCKDGACPLDAIVETDWSSATFLMNWKITRSDTWVVFEEGEPICQIFPVPRGSVEAFLPQMRDLCENPEMEHRYNEWKQSRQDFYRTLNHSLILSHGKLDDTPLWQKHYFRGMSVLGEVFSDHQMKLSIREFEDLRGSRS